MIIFISVASDLGLAFDSSLGPPSMIISVIHANELAQAALAKAREAAKVLASPSAQAPPVDGSVLHNAATALAQLARAKRQRPVGSVAPTRSSLRIKNLSFK